MNPWDSVIIDTNVRYCAFPYGRSLNSAQKEQHSTSVSAPLTLRINHKPTVSLGARLQALVYDILPSRRKVPESDARCEALVGHARGRRTKRAAWSGSTDREMMM